MIEQRKKDIDRMRQQYDQKLKEIIKVNKNMIHEKEKKWHEEKHNL